MPLLVVGASAGQLLPKAGAWMDTVKAVFGVMLLGVAVWMLSRILPGPVTLALWAALAFVTGYCLMTTRRPRATRRPRRRAPRVGALATVYGVLLLIGALAGRSDPLQPLAGLGVPAQAAPAGAAEAARVQAHQDRRRSRARSRGGHAQRASRRCSISMPTGACRARRWSTYTFPDPGVQAELHRAVLLQADVTANDDEDQALLQHFGILGPPTHRVLRRHRTRASGAPRRRFQAGTRVSRPSRARVRRREPVNSRAKLALALGASLLAGAAAYAIVRSSAAADRAASATQAEPGSVGSPPGGAPVARLADKLPVFTLADRARPAAHAAGLAGQGR